MLGNLSFPLKTIIYRNGINKAAATAVDRDSPFTTKTDATDETTTATISQSGNLVVKSFWKENIVTLFGEKIEEKKNPEA